MDEVCINKREDVGAAFNAARAITYQWLGDSPQDVQNC
jgi:hypothetical protein